MTDVLALVPARGGSKSIPRKNLLPLAGKPLIAHSIQHGLDCPSITRVLVTTDDEEIAEVARAFGAEVPFLRPADLAGDYSLDVEYHRHALEWLRDSEGYLPDFVVNLRPSHPMRNTATMSRAIETFGGCPSADSLRSVRLADQTPWKMWTLDENGFMTTAGSELDGIREHYNMPRQLLPVAYWQDGYIDIVRPDVVLNKGSTTGDSVLAFVIDEPTIDIDYADQLEAAESRLTGGAATTNAARKTTDTGTRYPS